MLKYHENEKATKETIHDEGWLKTGAFRSCSAWRSELMPFW